MSRSDPVPASAQHRRWPMPCVLEAASLALLLLTTTTATAQGQAAAARPDPLDPKASVPALTYGSSLARSRRPADDKPVSWREANDTVARIGGWRVYAREGQQPDVKSSAIPPATRPASAGHAGPTSP